MTDVGTVGKGWWSDVIGPGKALDTRQLSHPRHRLPRRQRRYAPVRARADEFSSISSYDQAEILRRVVEHLQHRTARRDRRRVLRRHGGAGVRGTLARRRRSASLSISAADRSHPMSTAWRSVQRAIVRYALANGDGPEGLRLARALAMATYRSPDEFAARFARPAPRASTDASSFRSSRICWRAAMRMPRPTFPKRSCACRSRSTCIRSMRHEDPRADDAGRGRRRSARAARRTCGH